MSYDRTEQKELLLEVLQKIRETIEHDIDHEAFHNPEMIFMAIGFCAGHIHGAYIKAKNLSENDELH